MRLNNIQTLDHANRFLTKYIAQYNKQFTLNIDNSVSVFERCPNEAEINNILVVRNPRVIDSGLSITDMKKTFIPIDKHGNPVFLRKKTQRLVIQTLDNQLFVNIDDGLYLLDEVHQHHLYSPEFDEPSIKIIKKAYTPKMTHPWKRSSYDSFISKQRSGNSINIIPECLFRYSPLFSVNSWFS